LSLTAASGGLRAIDGGYVYAPIPEASTTALMLAGLLLILGTRSARTRIVDRRKDLGLPGGRCLRSLAVTAITVAVLRAPGACLSVAGSKRHPFNVTSDRFCFWPIAVLKELQPFGDLIVCNDSTKEESMAMWA
jgi:hypothetical protein